MGGGCVSSTPAPVIWDQASSLAQRCSFNCEVMVSICSSWAGDRMQYKTGSSSCLTGGGGASRTGSAPSPSFSLAQDRISRCPSGRTRQDRSSSSHSIRVQCTLTVTRVPSTWTFFRSAPTAVRAAPGSARPVRARWTEVTRSTCSQRPSASSASSLARPQGMPVSTTCWWSWGWASTSHSPTGLAGWIRRTLPHASPSISLFRGRTAVAFHCLSSGASAAAAG
mmetsp:Transcript_25289/g.45721  ORF Transcript_25289/g.45721 Transcript_25289/m.45721 type:complete len:224 (+) Transcript_25289:3257-3928(+)